MDGKQKSLKDLSSEEFLRIVEECSPEELLQLSATASAPPAPIRRDVKAALLSKLLARNEGKPGVLSTIGWWESRRPIYNLIVGFCGLPSLLWLVRLTPSQTTILLLMALQYAIVANCFYTVGWFADIAARHLFHEKAQHFGMICFALGTIFSIGITVLLGLIAVLFASLVHI